MARIETIVVLASDISGETGASTFEIDPTAMVRDILKGYPKISLDLTDGEASDVTADIATMKEEVETAIAEAVGHLYDTFNALKAAGSSTTGGAASKPSTGKVSPVRIWARENGYTIADRGAIAAPIMEAYRKAHAATNLDTESAPAVAWDNSTAEEGDVTTVDGPTDAELEALAAEGV